ncbi:hypothetical protein ACTWQB_16490 [Piscibacillus sp. B03]|uniref:hypothetical protein n=1 Tax=Piscibacillus sp. B03 TaxID=3457430 RepID=UPI003FCD21C1
MEQLSLYDFIQKEEDPLYQKLSSVTESTSMTVEAYHISINEAKFYEITSDDEHVAASDLEDCYNKLTSLLTTY